jgi:kinesin family protein 11
LSEEKRKTATLRTELVSNLTNLIVGFTDAQEVSLDSALTSVTAANDAGMREMQAFAHGAGEAYAEGDGPRRAAEEELGMASRTMVKQREVGGESVQQARGEMEDAMREYGVQVEEEMKGLRVGVDGVCERFGEVAGDGESFRLRIVVRPRGKGAIGGEQEGIADIAAGTRAADRATLQSAHVQQLTEANTASYDNTRARIVKDQDSVLNLSDSLMKTVRTFILAFQSARLTHQRASTSKSYTKHSTATIAKLDVLTSTTASFMQNGLHEDTATGETPRKKQWNVPAKWERVQPRDRLIEAFRQRKAMGLPEPDLQDSGELDGWNGQDAASDAMRDMAAEMPLPRSRSSSPVEGEGGTGAGMTAVRSSDSVATMNSASSMPTAISGIPIAQSHGLGHSRIPSSSGIPNLSTSQMRQKRAVAGDRVASQAKMAPLGEHGGGLNVQQVQAIPSRRGEKRR